MFMWKNYIKVGVVVAVLLLLFGTAHAQDNPTAYAWIESLTPNTIEVYGCNLHPSGYAALIPQQFTAIHTATGEWKEFALNYREKIGGCYVWTGNWGAWKTGWYHIQGNINDYQPEPPLPIPFNGDIHINQLKLFFSIITFWR